MSKRLENRICIVVGGGQTAGATLGNGKATALRFAQEGATVLVADRNLASATDTADTVVAGGRQRQRHPGRCDGRGGSPPHGPGLPRPPWAHRRAAQQCRFSSEGGDSPIDSITEDVFDRIHAINLRGMVMTCKHTLEAMVRQGSGVIVNVGSIAAFNVHPTVAYKTSKAGVIALTQHIAVKYAALRIRANCILPGSMATPMAVDGAARRRGIDPAVLSAQRDACVPLRHKQGTAWDVANAALFLASSEADFITGINLPVDGGALAFVGNWGRRAMTVVFRRQSTLSLSTSANTRLT